MPGSRAVSWEGLHNARDHGGLPTVDGRRTRPGALIRSADLRFVTIAGWQSAVDAGVRTVIDLRDDAEAGPGSSRGGTSGAASFTAGTPAASPIFPAAVRVLRVPVDDSDDITFWQRLDQEQLTGTPLYYRSFIEAKPGRCAAALAAVARARPGGVIFHCGAGLHRTGLVSLLVLSLAGVTPDAIAEDYELSRGHLGPLLAALGVQDQQPSMRAALQRRGITIRQAILDVLDGLDVAQCLRPAGFSDADSDALRARLI